MTSTRDAVAPPGWTEFFNQTGIPEAIRDGDVLHVTGHTGDRLDGTFASDAEEQLRQTFANVQAALEASGASWADVQSIHSYHVGLRAQGESIGVVAAEFMDLPYPAWTAVGVMELWEAEALVEIECLARLPKAG
jgi:enamine deaminase RidA (YjgF/YER057c/UK114 family)